MLFLLAGCSSGGYSGGPSTAPPAPSTTVSTTVAVPSSSTSTTLRAPTSTTRSTTATTVAGEVVVRATAAQVLASARVVVLAQPVAGFTTIAFTADTEVVRANGDRAAMGDVTPGANIEATGRPGTAGALLARRVVLL